MDFLPNFGGRFCDFLMILIRKFLPFTIIGDHAFFTVKIEVTGSGGMINFIFITKAGFFRI
jgi:hypothetical protein